MKQLAGSGPLLRGLDQAPRHKVDELWGPAVAVPEGGRRLGGNHKYSPKGKKYILIHPKRFKQCRGAGAGGAVIKLPSGAGAVITNSAPDSLLPVFYQRLEEILLKKS
jgi:hypothetical protein